MQSPGRRAIYVVMQPGAFALRVLRTFRANQALLLAGQSAAVAAELARFLDHRRVMSWVLLATMIFFSSLAFTVLENAMSVIFLHRVATRRRHFLISAIIPYCYIVFLGCGLLLMT